MKSLKLLMVATCLAAVSLSVQARETEREKANIRTVEALYSAALNDKDFAKARTYIGDRYIPHNPTARNGIDGLKAFIDFLRAKFPESHSDIKQAFADGNYVILHVHSVRVPGTLGRAIVDIFRLENGKVVEHWDVVQDIPEHAANSNTMF
ncbi:MAG: ester cyclase [Steroidobacteraceae bacterium]